MIASKKLSCLVLLFATLLSAGCNLLLDADARVERAAEKVASGDYQAAAIELQNALKKEPEHVRARLMLAEVSLELGDALGAEKEVQRALKSGAQIGQSAELIAKIRLALGQGKELLIQIDSGELPLAEPLRSTYRGYALLAMRQADSAVDAFNTAIKADPAMSMARTGLAEALAARGDTDEALRNLDQVLKADPTNASALLARGTVLARRGQFAEAETALLAAAEPNAGTTRHQRGAALVALTETRLAHGDIAGARASLDQLNTFAGGTTAARLLGARILMASQDYAAAAAELHRIVTALPELVSARFLLGAALLAQDNLNQAESQLARVVLEAPENLEARKLLAQVRLRLEQPNDAMRALTSDQTDESDPQVSALLGLAYLQLGEDSRALQLFERSAASNPGNHNAQLELAVAYLRAKEPKKASALLRSIPRVDGDSRREMLLVAAATAEGGMDAGKSQVEQLLRDHPDDPGTLNTAGRFFAQLGEFERSRALLAKALAARPKDIETLLNVARVEAAAGNPGAAAGRLEGVLAIDPNNTVARLALAELAVRGNDMAGAARWFEEVTKRQPNAIEPRLQLAKIYLRAKRTKDADDLLRALGTEAANRHEVLNAIGLLYLGAGRYDEASSQLRKAAELDSRNVAYWLDLARAQLALDRPSAARESLEKARTTQPDSVAVSRALMMVDLKEGRKDAAASRVAQLRKERPNDAGVATLEGDFYMTQSQYVEAARAYDRAAAIKLDGTTAVKSYRARLQGKLDHAAAPLEAWLARQPDDLSVQMVLADEYQRTGQRQKAIEKYELIVSNGAASAVALNNLAWLYQESADARAEMTAKRAYQLANAAPQIADTYGWVLVENGKVAEGMEILKAAVEAAPDHPDLAFHYAAALARSGDTQAAHRRLTSLLETHETFASQGDARRLLQSLSQR